VNSDISKIIIGEILQGGKNSYKEEGGSYSGGIHVFPETL
jgi:hypothetical protein